jgi:hypothetical protein
MSIRSTLVGTQDKNGLDAQRTVIHELRRIKTAIVQGALGDATAANQATMITALNSANTSLDNIELYSYRANWTTVIGNSIEYTYYAGVEAGNPTGATTNVKTIVYKTGITTIFTQTIAYNAADLVISIITS